MINIILSVIQLIVFISCTLGLGSIFIKKKDADEGDEYPVFTFTAGLGIIILIAFVSASLGFLNIWLFAGVVIIGNIIFFINRGEFKNFQIKFRFSILLVPLLIFLILNLFYVLFPPSFYDSMSYHLAVPNFYILKGGMVPWPGNFYSNLPLNGEMIFMFSLLGGSVYIPKLISFASGIFILVLLFSWSRNFLKGKNRILPVILFLSIPQVSFLFSSSKTDIIGMLFLLSGARFFIGSLNSINDKKKLLLSGIFLGLAIGTKYIFAFYAAGFFISVIILKGICLKRKVFVLSFISLIILLTLSPWFVKNIVFTGNPVYPYMNEIFENKDWGPGQATELSGVVRGGEKGIIEFLVYPFKIFFSPYKFGMTAVWGLLFLVFLPALLFIKKEKRLVLLTGLALIPIILMIPFGSVPRYFLASFLFLSLPVSSGIEKSGEKSVLVRKITIPLLIFLLVFNLAHTAGLQEKFSLGFRYLKGKLSGEFKGRDVRYLYGLPYYRGVQFINKTLERGDKVAFVGEDRTFYLKKDFIANSFLDRNIVLEILRDCTDFSCFLERLQNEGITHIFYSENGVKRLGRLSFTFRLNREEQDKFDIFLFNFDILYRDQNYILYSVSR